MMELHGQQSTARSMLVDTLEQSGGCLFFLRERSGEKKQTVSGLRA
jgi:hypothetical protein